MADDPNTPPLSLPPPGPAPRILMNRMLKTDRMSLAYFCDHYPIELVMRTIGEIEASRAARAQDEEAARVATWTARALEVFADHYHEAESEGFPYEIED
jgi:hypothetical protein